MRIVSRPDFDGVVSAALIGDAEGIDQPVYWLEPNDFQKKTAEIRPGDIIANLPYHPDCALWFDHHATNRVDAPFRGLFREAPSAARNVYDYFRARLSRDFSELVDWADRIDSAAFTAEEVLRPQDHDHVLLSMTISGERPGDVLYWERLAGLLRRVTVREVMGDPEVARRCRRTVEENAQYGRFLAEYTRVVGPVSVTDLRALTPAPAGNRFLVYSLFPQAAVNVRIRFEEPRRETVVVNVGHSIFNPGCRVHVGRMLTAFNGGGHRGAGSARFPAARADEYLERIMDTLIRNRSEEAQSG